MKKIFIILLSLFLLTSCSLFDKKRVKNNDTKITEEDNISKEPEYVDDNIIIIGLYEKAYPKLKIYKEFSTKVTVKKDINTFQAYFSNDEEVSYSGKNYGDFYFEKYEEVNKDRKYKVGFNLKYTLVDGTEISQNILGPSTTQTNYDYIETYLYDGYNHRHDSFYSHIEEKEYNENTMITSIKLTAGSKYNDINSRITLTTFTYDEDDFDPITNEYRGNSKYSVVISDLNKNYEN